MKEHGQRADGIVHSMLEHSRATPGEWRETDVNALLKQYVDLAYHAMRANNSDFNVTLTQDLDPEMGTLEVVPQDLGRVFLNLVTNACQAVEEKRRKSDGDYEPQLRIASRRLEDQAEFCIRDNGPGIPEELRERIFEPFMTTKRRARGTGLGLSLTTDILTRHGGSIRLDSEEGAFTEMRVVLPLEPPAEAARGEIGENRRILSIEQGLCLRIEVKLNPLPVLCDSTSVSQFGTAPTLKRRLTVAPRVASFLCRAFTNRASP